MELYDTDDAKVFGRGIEAFMKEAKLEEADAEEFLEATRNYQLNSVKAENEKVAFEAGLLKFAADQGLTDEEYANFLAVANRFLES